MKLQVLQENFSKALTITSRFASSRVQLPVLANILLSTKNNKLFLSATNLEVSISISVGAKIEKKGDITIPAKNLTDIVANLPHGAIGLAAQKEQLKLSTTFYNSLISGMNASDFPEVPYEIPVGHVGLPLDELVKALSQVVFAASVDETRPVLTGVLLVFDGTILKLVATDGFRLSQKQITLKKSAISSRMILPKNALVEVSKLSEDGKSVKFLFQEKENQVIFGMSNSVLTSRIIDGEFPDYEKIIPKASGIVVNVDKSELLRSVKLASVFAREAANVVKLVVKENRIEMFAQSQKSGNQKSSIDAKVEGEVDKKGFEIAFNYRFIEDFLNSINGDDVKIELSESNAPAVFIDIKDKDYLHIIMPVRIDS